MNIIVGYYDRATYYFLLLFAFLLPLSRVSDTLFTIYFFLYFIIAIIFYRDNKLFKEKFFIVTSLFIVYVVVSLMWSVSKEQTIGDASHYIQWFAIFGVAIFINKNIETIDKVITLFLAGMIVSEVLSYGMFLEFWTIKGRGALEPTPFMMHIDYSVYIAVSALILLNRVFSKSYSFKVRVIMALFFMTMCGNLFINGGRTGQVAFIIAMLVAFFIHFKISFKNFIFIISLCIAIISTAFYSSSTFQKRASLAVSDIKKLIYDNNYQTSLGQRVGMVVIAPQLVKDHILLGNGINSQKEVVTEFINRVNPPYFTNFTKNFLKHNHMHNQFLQTFVELGLIGLIMLFLVFYQIAKFIIVYKEFRELKIIFLTIFIFSSIPEPLFLKQFTNILFILFIGVLFGLHINSKRVNIE